MQIDKTIFSESNYTGSRLIPIENDKIKELQEVLSGYQKEINPILDRLTAEYYPKIDPLYQEVQRFAAESRKIKEEMAEISAGFKADTEFIEQMEQKATLIKNKMQPLIQKEIEGLLGEFEIARHTVVKDGQIFVEVFDQIEEKVKEIRANKK
jgi:2-hydroxy-3-keto-5-methylthiopentenyl-1-phosphate phosphatase